MTVFQSFLSSPETVETFGERCFVAAMLRFEATLAQAQAAEGLVPDAAARCIVDCCRVESFDLAAIVRGSARAGSLAIPMIERLREAVRRREAEAARFVHLGSTSQDVIDTAMALVTRDALDLIEADLRTAASALLSHAARHASAPMLARTLMQPASITSFGLKCVQWAAPLVRGRLRLAQAAARALQVQLGGPVGTLAQMQGRGPEVRRRMAQALELRDPGASWHTQRDEWVALGCELGLLVGSLGKVALDISLLAQHEVGEVSEPEEPGRGGSSAMPHKRNPVASMLALAAARRAPQCVAALLCAMPQQNERALGAWQAELAEWADLVMAARGSVRALAQALPGLQVDTTRMLDNIERLRGELPDEAANAWFDPALAEAASAQARAQAASLREQLGRQPAMPASPEESDS